MFKTGDLVTPKKEYLNPSEKYGETVEIVLEAWDNGRMVTIDMRCTTETYKKEHAIAPTNLVDESWYDKVEK